MPDDLAALLAQIRADHEAANAFGANADDPVPLLLGAIRAVLKQAGEWDAEARKADARAGATGHLARVSDEATVLSTRAQALEDCGRDIREAITRKLTRKDADHA